MKNEKHKIDDLFNEKLREGKEHPGNWEQDWSVLEERLKKQDDRKRIVFWLKTAGGVAALLLLTLSLWLIRPDGVVQPPTHPQQPITKTENPKIQSDNEGVGKPSEEFRSPDRTRITSSSIINATKIAATGVTAGKSDAHNFLEKQSAGQQIVAHAKERLLMADVAEVTLVPEKISDTQVALLPLAETKTTDRSALASTIKKSVLLASKGPKISLSILYAPAVNGVNGLSDGKMGNDIGLLFNFGLTKRWSLSTGAIYAAKLYETGFSNYRPDNNFTFKYAPQKVDADCRVLDIPLNVNYTLYNKRKNSFGIGTGISSYIMLKEDYHFIYDTFHSKAIQDFQLVNKNQHWLGVLNLQASYDRRINSKFSVGLQPYMRIPMQDIGFANVKLQSFGMGVRVNWNLNTLFPTRATRQLFED